MRQSNIKRNKHKAVIFESANGITYARFRDDPTIPRWKVGGNTKGWIQGTQIQCPEDWNKFETIHPDFATITNNPKLKEVYTKFLEEQLKYKTWEQLGGR